jgi:hypothetical protein
MAGSWHGHCLVTRSPAPFHSLIIEDRQRMNAVFYFDSAELGGSLNSVAAVAQTMHPGEDLARAAVVDGVTAAPATCGVPRPAAGLAGRAAADELMKAPLVRHYDDVLRAVQGLADHDTPATDRRTAVPCGDAQTGTQVRDLLRGADVHSD